MLDCRSDPGATSDDPAGKGAGKACAAVLNALAEERVDEPKIHDAMIDKYEVVDVPAPQGVIGAQYVALLSDKMGSHKERDDHNMVEFAEDLVAEG